MQLQVSWSNEEVSILDIEKSIESLNASNSKNSNEYAFQFYETPLGGMVGVASDKGLCLLAFCNQKYLFQHLSEISVKRNATIRKMSNNILKEVKNELETFFQNKLKAFTVPIDFVGTDFQIKVWKALLDIEYGTTYTYLQLSNKIANASSVRAVSNANAKNKISIIVPCHRVIGTNHSLTGYAGGIDRKQQLLILESNF